MLPHLPDDSAAVLVQVASASGNADMGMPGVIQRQALRRGMSGVLSVQNRKREMTRWASEASARME